MSIYMPLALKFAEIYSLFCSRKQRQKVFIFTHKYFWWHIEIFHFAKTSFKILYTNWYIEEKKSKITKTG